MKRKTRILLAAGITAAVIGTLAALRPRLSRWGATEHEAEMRLPGDDLADENSISVTHAVEVNADVDSVWPWLIQVGQGRGGFYSYTWLQTLIGSTVKNVEDISVNLQKLKEGDQITLHPSVSALRVVNLDPPQNLVLEGDQAGSSKCGKMFHKIVWSFHLRPHGRSSSRVIARMRVNRSSAIGRKLAMAFFFEPAHFIMERKMLLSIKALAERANGTDD
jgi:hypothetical protein